MPERWVRLQGCPRDPRILYPFFSGAVGRISPELTANIFPSFPFCFRDLCSVSY